jgi:hypothetical protein
MKFKVDENLPQEVAGILRGSGHDAVSVFDQALSGKPPTCCRVHASPDPARANARSRVARHNPLDMTVVMLTVAEVPEFIRRAERLLTADERRDLVNYLAVRPRAGVLLEGTGGVRKLRWGARVGERAAGCG